MKNSQLSLLLAGLLLLAFLFMVSSYIGPKPALTQRPAAIENDELAIKSFMQTCVDDSLEKGIEAIASQGGYFRVEEPLIRFDEGQIPLYLYKNKIDFPSRERVKSELEHYALNHIANCLAELMAYQSQGYKIEAKNPTALVNFWLNSTELEVSVLTEFTKEGSFFSVNEFSSLSTIDAGRMHLALSELMDVQQKDRSGIPLGSISRLATKYDFYYHLEYLDNETVRYNLAFMSDRGRNVTLVFASQYHWNEGKADALETAH